MKRRSIVNDIICQYEEGYKKSNHNNHEQYKKWLDKTTKRTAKLLAELIALQDTH